MLLPYLKKKTKYIALTEAIKEAILVQGMIGDSRMKLGKTIVYCDSQSAIH